MDIPSIIYVTGGGKCGTHLVSSYLSQNHPQIFERQVEFNSWRDDLINESNGKPQFTFHCPDPDAKKFRELAPNGLMLVLLRHPVQHYVSWITAQFHRVKANHGYFDPKINETVFHVAFRRVIQSFYAAAEADGVWRIEDFTSSKSRRQRLIHEFLGGNVLSTDDVGKSDKSTFNWQNSVHPIKGDEYPALLTRHEMDAFAIHDAKISEFYPDWSRTVATQPKDDIEVLRIRSAFSMRVKMPGLRRSHVSRLKSGHINSLIPLVKDTFLNPQKLAANLDIHSASFVLGDGVLNYSRQLRNEQAPMK